MLSKCPIVGTKVPKSATRVRKRSYEDAEKYKNVQNVVAGSHTMSRGVPEINIT
jgi:hypothetical protein